MRSRISIRGCVRRSVRPSVRPLHTSWISAKWAEFEQNSIRKIKLCHLKDNSETSTLADRQNASDVWTLSDLFRNDWAQLSHLKVVFEVSVGDGYLGDIAIDDIVLDTQPCGPRRECDFEVGQRLCHKLCTNLVFLADGLFNNNIEFPNSRQGSEWRITITWNVRTRYKMRYLDQHQSIKE